MGKKFLGAFKNSRNSFRLTGVALRPPANGYNHPYIYIYCILISTKMIFSKLSPWILFWTFYTIVSLISQLRALKKPDSNSMCVPQFHFFKRSKLGCQFVAKKPVGTIFYYWTIKFCSAKNGQLVRPFPNGGIWLSSSQKKPFQLWPCF